MICTTIRKVYLDEIAAGRKKIEYRADKEFWHKKIEGKRHGAIIFLCGRRTAAFTIARIERIQTPVEIINVIGTPLCYAIHLGGGISLAEAREVV